jgi:hypothetical protein
MDSMESKESNGGWRSPTYLLNMWALKTQNKLAIINLSLKYVGFKNTR